MPPAPREFDFIVVGAGAAGCVVARCLAQQNVGSVALIEAGPAQTDVRSSIPAWYPKLFGSRFDWSFQTRSSEGLAGRRIAWPRGRALGGSTAINALIYLQSPDEDFRRWGWKSPPLPNFDASGDAAFCSVSGLPLSPVRHPHPWCEQFLHAAESVGLERSNSMLQSPSFGGGNRTGSLGQCGQYWLTQDASNRRRHVGQQLRHDQPESLHILTAKHADSVLVKAGRAKGVRFSSQNSQERIYARREVILCAGALGSPHILMRSGIGPANSLETAGIRCIVDSPHIGQHLQDHLVYPIVYENVDSKGLPSRFSPSERRAFRTGRPSNLASNIAEAGAVFQIGADQTAFQIHATPTHYLKYPRLATEHSQMSLGLTPLRPRSQGALKVAPGTGELVITPNYLSVALDLDDMTQAVDWVREKLTQHLALRGWSELIPGRRGDKVNLLHRSIAAYSTSIYHPTSTCRMGDSIDTSVVGSDFKVHGVEGLRIADASVFPDIPASNTMAPTFWAAKECASRAIEIY